MAFICDTTPIVDVILEEAQTYKTRANEIETRANDRSDLIKKIEEDAAVAGDLPKDKHVLLTRLKGEVTGSIQ